MAGKVDRVYLGNTRPSEALELYLSEFEALFSIEECKTREEYDDCNKDLREYIDENELLYNNQPIDAVGYPAVVKGHTAYIIRSPAELEDLLGCGSLSTP
jgi:hypothetical protein